MAPLHYYTRSHRVRDEVCPRSRYWWSVYGGRGIERDGEAFELSFGTLVHTALAGLMDPAGGQSLDELVSNGVESLGILLAGRDELTQREYQTLFEAFVRGFARVVRPRLLEQYEVVSIEREFTRDQGEGIRVGVKPDLILRRKFDGTLWYVEYKTTGNVKKEWLESWNTSVQLMAGAMLAGETLGEPVEGCIIQGLYKGYKYQGELRTPLVYRWRKPGLPGETDEIVAERPTRWAGWHREGLWEGEGGVAAWIEQMPEEVLLGQFPQTPPIFLNKELVETWLRQSAIREGEIDAVQRGFDAGQEMAPETLDRTFPQYFSQCKSTWGRGCDFFDCCWFPHIGADPIGSGLYRERQFHHEGERDARED